MNLIHEMMQIKRHYADVSHDYCLGTFQHKGFIMQLTFSKGSFLVTGASSGIGAQAARQLARAGADVVLTARRLDRCQQIAQELTDEGHSATARRLDITDSEAVFALMEELAAGPSGLAGALNNAARLEPAMDLEAMPIAEAQKTWETNVLAQMRLLQAQLPSVAASGGGALVFTGSVAADLPLYELAPYAASKAALRSLVRSAASRAGQSGVRVNLLTPGPTHTAMGHAAFGGPQALDQAMSQTPAGRGATAEEVASSALWLLSEQAVFINGTELVVDGGYSLG